MSLEFVGRITEIRDIRSGEGQKGEWANAEFEVTESNPQNDQYPQIGLFDFFKNGEYVKYAKDFNNYYKIGDEVRVSFNLKKNEYTKSNGEPATFYKTSCWKLEKIDSSSAAPPIPPVEAFQPTDDLNEEEPGDLPFG